MQFTSSATSLNELDVLTGAIDHLCFVSETIDRSQLSEVTQLELQQQIAIAQQRLHDPHLYLAVIGEFSSGKSTLINALLRDQLLKTSALVTTAAATQLCYSASLTVEIELQGTRSGVLKTQPNSQQITVPWLPKIDRVNNRQLIDLVTTDETIAPQVKAVTIHHPAQFLSHGITIIDTPGTNATQAEHAAITRQVVEQTADAAIVIIPATVPLSQSFTRFLQSALRPYLHRCIFVVTRMDQIRESEQSALLSDLRTRLKQQLDIEPPLYACAAQVLLDHLNGEYVSDSLSVWISRFEQLEAIILQRLQQERSLNIAEHILRLLTQLLHQLEQSLQLQRQTFTARQSVITRELIPDLDAFTLQQQTIAQTRIRNASSSKLLRLSCDLEQCREQKIATLKTQLFAITSASALSSFVAETVKNTFNSSHDRVMQMLQPELINLSEIGMQAGAEFDQQFASVYRRLEAIGSIAAIMPPPIAQPLNVPQALTTAQLCSDLDSKVTGWTMGGIGSGALIGTLILPGVGTLIGSAIGLGLSRLATPSLAERQQQLWDTLRPELDRSFNALKHQIQVAIDQQTQQIAAQLQQRIELHRLRYQQTVEQLLHEQKTDLNRLDREQQQLQADLQEIHRRRETLQTQQQRFASSRI